MSVFFITLFLLMQMRSYYCEKFLLVTFHGGNGKGEINNIYRFTLNGVFAGTVIENAYQANLDLLRGMMYSPEQDIFLVLNAYVEDSRILSVSSPCTGMAKTLTMENLDHPYGISLRPNSDFITVSNQNTGEISQYNALTGAVDPINPILVQSKDPRGLVWSEDGAYLFIAEKGKDKLTKYSHRGGWLKDKKVKNPIGVTIHGDNVFVSSDESDDPSVYAYNIYSMDLVRKYTDNGNGDLSHPCGLAVDGQYIYVLSQDTKSLLRFAISDGTYQVLVSGFTDWPEDLIIIPDCPASPTPSPISFSNMSSYSSHSVISSSSSSSSGDEINGGGPKLGAVQYLLIAFAVILLLGSIVFIIFRMTMNRSRKEEPLLYNTVDDGFASIQKI